MEALPTSEPEGGGGGGMGVRGHIHHVIIMYW